MSVVTTVCQIALLIVMHDASVLSAVIFLIIFSGSLVVDSRTVVCCLLLCEQDI